MHSDHICPRAITKIPVHKDERACFMAGITPSYFLALGKFVSFPSLEKAMIKGIYYIFEGELVLESPSFCSP